jgi:hypothetical protein
MFNKKKATSSETPFEEIEKLFTEFVLNNKSKIQVVYNFGSEMVYIVFSDGTMTFIGCDDSCTLYLLQKPKQNAQVFKYTGEKTERYSTLNHLFNSKACA